MLGERVATTSEINHIIEANKENTDTDKDDDSDDDEYGLVELLRPYDGL